MGDGVRAAPGRGPAKVCAGKDRGGERCHCETAAGGTESTVRIKYGQGRMAPPLANCFADPIFFVYGEVYSAALT